KGHDGLKINVAGRCRRGKGQEFIGAYSLPDILHQKAEIGSILRRGRYIGQTTSGIFPIHIDPVQSKFHDHPLAINRKSLPFLWIGGHFTEIATPPTSQGEEYLQGRKPLLELHY